jgi:hypothetical protein
MKDLLYVVIGMLLALLLWSTMANVTGSLLMRGMFGE